ncbi:MAG: GAF domain-containing protein [Candidatus Wallbacteria bacterium]|nr:GAF domain-containing protein [Candidatus Wallbacteria bacterium]
MEQDKMTNPENLETLRNELKILKKEKENRDLLLEVNKSIYRITELNVLLDLLVQAACKVLDAEAGSVLLLDKKTSELVFEVATGESGDMVKSIRVPLGRGIAGTVAKSGEPLLIKDVKTDNRWFNTDSQSNFITKSIMCVPLRLKHGEIIGVMEILNSLKNDTFLEEDVELFQAFANQAAVAIDSARLYKELEENYLSTIRALANTIDAKDAYTRGHSHRVTEYSVSVGKAMGFNSKELKELRFGALLHDIGKIGIPEEIIGKRAKLTDMEFKIIQNHPNIGSSIVDPIVFLQDKIPSIRYHHERYDGKGYPEGLKGDTIPLFARIIAVADTFDAMTSNRPYREGLPLAFAVDEIRKNSGSQFDPKIVTAFLSALERDTKLFTEYCNKEKVKIHFRYLAPQAKTVYLIGDFNFWNATMDPMTLSNDGYWIKDMELNKGKYEYKFIVDGNWVVDPESKDNVENSVRGQSSVINVGVENGKSDRGN